MEIFFSNSKSKSLYKSQLYKIKIQNFAFLTLKNVDFFSHKFDFIISKF